MFVFHYRVLLVAFYCILMREKHILHFQVLYFRALSGMGDKFLNIGLLYPGGICIPIGKSRISLFNLCCLL